MIKFFHNREELGGLLLQPILWVTLFGVGMGALVGSVGGIDYMSFMLPGILALTALGGAVGGGMSLLDERLRGILKEYLVAPIPRLSILLGNAASTVTKALFQAAIILVVGALMGARITSNPLGWLALVVLLTLFTFGFAGIALAFAARSSSIMGYHGLIFLFNLPLLFASNALYPLVEHARLDQGDRAAQPNHLPDRCAARDHVRRRCDDCAADLVRGGRPVRTAWAGAGAVVVPANNTIDTYSSDIFNE